MKAVVLSAGSGTRLEPLTLDRQKNMLPVAGKPILQITLESLREAGITEVLIIVKEFKEQIQDYFGDGSRFGMKITYIDQEKAMGTAHAVSKACDFVDSTFLVTSADEVTSAQTFIDFIKTPEQKIGARKVEDASQYGSLKVNGDYLEGIVEKSKNPPSNLINAALYLFEPDVFDYIDKTPLSKRNEYEITDTIGLMIKDKKRFKVEALSGYRRDVGMPWHLLDVNEDLMKDLKHEVKGKVEDGAVLKPPVFVGEGTVIKSGTYIEGPVYIGKNCVIGPSAYLRPSTAIMDNCHVGRAELKNCIFMEGSKASHVSYLGDSILGENVNIAAGVVCANLRHDNKSTRMKVKEDHVDTGRRKLGAIIGSNTKTGVNCTVMPGVKIGMNVHIGPNAIIYKDIESNNRVIVKQEYY